MLTIRGHSDDIVCANVSVKSVCSECGGKIDGPDEGFVVEEEDEIGAYNQDLIFYVGDASGAVAIVYGYSAMGCWFATVSLVDEDIQIPWPVSIKSEGYSIVVMVDCPVGTPVSVGKKGAS